MRWLALCATAAFLLMPFAPGPARAEEGDGAGEKPNPRLHAFYYPWYATPAVDGAWSHWNHEVLDDSGRGFPGGDDIGANFYPLSGCTSSNSETHVEQHMRELRRARVGVICVSWWGVDSFSDQTLPLLFRLAEKHGIAIDFHLEPRIHEGTRDAISTRVAIRYLLQRWGEHPALYRDAERGGRPVFFVYDSYLTSPEAWRTLLDPTAEETIRGTPHDAVVLGLWVKEGDGPSLRTAGFDGFYTYFATDGFTYGSTIVHWPVLQKFAKEHGMLFVPCVGPGYDDTRIRPWNAKNRRSRDGGAYYDRAFEAALGVQPACIGITSFNEWHEGTQIEPATPKTVGKYTYVDYAPRSPTHYLDRTAFWADRLDRLAR